MSKQTLTREAAHELIDDTVCNGTDSDVRALAARDETRLTGTILD